MKATTTTTTTEKPGARNFEPGARGFGIRARGEHSRLIYGPQRRGDHYAGGLYVGTTASGVEWVARSTAKFTVVEAFARMVERFDGLAVRGGWVLNGK